MAKKIKTKKKPKKLIKKFFKKTKRPVLLKEFNTVLKKECSGGLVETIIKKGKDRGFITFAEILSAFPHIEHDIIFLEDLYSRLDNAGVDVLEGRELLELPNEPDVKIGKREAKR